MLSNSVDRPSDAERRIYCLVGVPPEIQAYAMARYSRSSESMLESVRELTTQRAEQFLATFYFQYGHRSIADLAHLAVALENISIRAAVDVVDEPLWDGQERSTRYQDFRRTGYYVPTEIRDTPGELSYRATADGLFQAYEKLSAELLETLLEHVPSPPDLDRRQKERALRARAFDVARYLLPLATNTSVGQVISARVLEQQICRLLSNPLEEVRAIGAELRCAGESPAATIEGPATGQPAAPTLVKYAAPSSFLQEAGVELQQMARDVLGTEPARADRAVELAEEESLLDETVATLLYQADPLGRSYRQIQAVVRDLSESRKREAVDLSLRGRREHDDLLRGHRSGYALKFDVCIDFGSFRDLHRHRRCVQVLQGPRLSHGFDSPELIFQRGLGDAENTTGALQREYQAALDRAAEDAGPHGDLLAPYLYPMAVRTRTLFKMDAAEAAYIIELRTGPAGHFSYRHAAWEMYLELQRRQPHLAAQVRATDPNQVFDLLRR